MDYSNYRPEDANRLRQHDERIQLLREQRELGLHILKEMTERNAFMASLAGAPQNMLNTGDGLRPTARTCTTHKSLILGTIQTGGSARPIDAEDNDVTVASNSPRRSKTRRFFRSRSPSSLRRQKTRGSPPGKKYPLFSVEKRYSSIVRTQDGVVELACHFCGGNTYRSQTSGWKYLSGVQGMQKHIRISHPYDDELVRSTKHSMFGWVAENCVSQVLSNEEKREVRLGRYEVYPIQVRMLYDANDVERPFLIIQVDAL